MPRASYTPGSGFTLHDLSTGREIGKAATAEEATRIAAERADLTLEDDAAAIANITAAYQRAENAGGSGSATVPPLDSEQAGTVRPETEQIKASSPAQSEVSPNPFKDASGNWKFSPSEIQQIDESAFEQAKRTRTVNTDDARAHVPGYDKANPLTRDNEVHGLASAINTRILDRMIAEPVTVGRVIILAGGGGSGKSTTSSKFAPKADFTIDTTFSSPASAAALIAKIRGSGREVEVLYVHRRFPLALDNIINRYLTEKHRTGAGRIVPVDVAIDAHIGAQQTVLGLSDVPTQIIDNNGTLGEAHTISLEKLVNEQYLLNHETGTEKDTSSEGRNSRTGDPSTQGGSSRSGGGSSDSRRAEAEARLRSEGERIIEELRESGELTDAEADAFLGRGSADKANASDKQR